MDMSIGQIVEEATPAGGSGEAEAALASAAAETTPLAAAAPAEPAVKTYTQAEVDQQIEDRVARARAELTKSPEEVTPAEKLYTREELEQHEKVAANRTARKFADYGEIKRKLDELTNVATQHDELKGNFAVTEAERDSLKTQITRLEVAIEHKLPKELALRLTGLTREEIEADAVSLAQLAGTAAGGFGGGPSTAAGSSTQGSDFNESLRRAAGFSA